MLYALTINPSHQAYIPPNESIFELVNIIRNITNATYINIVNHNDDHYHALISCEYDLQSLIDLKAFHVEVIRSYKAYIKYMYDHDLVTSYEWGEMPYIENNDDGIIQYCIQHGAEKTVVKYGMKALRVYKTLKEFYDTYTFNKTK